MGLCAAPCYEVHHTKLHFSGPADPEIEKGAYRCKYTLPLASLNFFQQCFCDNRDEGVWILQKGP